MGNLNRALVRISELAVNYGTHRVLGQLSCALYAGDWLVCTGPSGSGKSTLAALVAGRSLIAATVEGQVTREGKAALVEQEAGAWLHPMRRVGAQIADVLAANGRSPRDTDVLLDRVGLSEKKRAYPNELSSGQLQRVALARAVAIRPSVLVADEATASLDEENERRVIALVSELRAEFGFAVLWFTHRPKPVEHVATGWLDLVDGAWGPPASEDANRDAQPAVRANSHFHGNGAPLIDARGVHKSYQRPVLRDVTLRLRPGRTIGLRGASGSGKSTLARCLAKLEPPDAGAVEHSAPVQLVMPDPLAALNPGMTVADLIAEPLEVRGVSYRDRRRAALGWMDRLWLEGSLARRRAHEISGGQRRRVLIARAMIAEPRAVIFDEAANGLDRELCMRTLALLREFQRERGLAYLWISHHEETLDAFGNGFADEIVRLEEGILRPETVHAY
ncbi:MAG: ABC transporter ATP-binding protein [Bryobacterales bacterium]|nr:ABC transporter ATP-binding protein [Bryobacterales bacterium]